MKKTVVINAVGLTRRLIGTATPRIRDFMEAGKSCDIYPVLPAVTCAAQATYLTGKEPSEHGIVGNGWFFKEEFEVKFWRQANQLVQGPKLWDLLKEAEPGFTCANMFWWYNMYSSVDYSVTPRPNYLADGRKIPDVYSHPAGLRDELQDRLGQFPLFKFWGPMAGIESTRWITDAAIHTDRTYDPTLTLIYLPHLDYNMQRLGPDLARLEPDLRALDAEVGRLLDHYVPQGAQVVILSEYGITAVSRPVHLNRVLRNKGLLAIRVERGLELLDAGASEAFAVADHQVAHIYVRNPARLQEVRELIAAVPGVEKVLTGESRKAAGLDHDRAGDLVAVAGPDSWFTYYFWEDDSKAPDYARMVDIHKKPGYDPVELLTDPSDPLVKLKILWKLARKKLGFRSTLNVIPLRAELVRGSHGRIPEDTADYPIFISNNPGTLPESPMPPTAVFGELYRLARGL
ncbi:alkaline phosphatase family protein [Robiginitalea sp. SC105]|uniref:alkaline phosphatase family protein n=1 Tax=Robiginitalea sp. SC105 TaxID=2762332 RepID=UPI00163B2855|nr:nucleotide pyrophosphatase/phosphodiesterase family protein [Robiginitalea sp. SC105]MBC2840218.1 alkaline phosphatase family protein [Robiginitalea sp. SC105]